MTQETERTVAITAAGVVGIGLLARLIYLIYTSLTKPAIPT